MTAATGPPLYTGNLAFLIKGFAMGMQGVWDVSGGVWWVVDCTTNSCRSSVESIQSACFSVVDEFTDGEGHDVRCKMLAALYVAEIYGRKRGSRGVEFQALRFYVGKP